MKKVICYDLEVVKAIYTGGDRIPGIEYVEGWGEKHLAGVSVCAVWADWLSIPMVFGQDNIHQMNRLIAEADLCVGFNNRSFDDVLLGAEGVTVPVDKSFDILAKWQAITGKRVKLGDLCNVNFGTQKREEGAMAPVYWQQGEKFRVISYALADVCELTLALWKAIQEGRPLTCPYTGRQVIIERP